MTNASSPEPHLGWFSRGYLPHWDHPGMMQSLTFRLGDSLPRAVVDKWKRELGLPVEAGAPPPGAPASCRQLLGATHADAANLSHTRRQDAGAPGGDRRQIELWKRIARYEDAGHGACWLRDPPIARLVENALLHFDAQRYRLLAWCIMPNHVHVMIETKEGFPLSGVLFSWKSYTAKAANKLLGRQGEFWQREYRDRYIRHAQHFVDAIRYIENNPVKAGLVRQAAEWLFSSARHR